MSLKALAFALVAFACAPRLIPGTEVEDTDDNQRILTLIEDYRRSAEST